MSDYLLSLSNHSATRTLIRGLGLPTPVTLERAEGPYTANLLAGRNLLLLSPDKLAVSKTLHAALTSAGARVPGAESISEGRSDFHGLIFDARGIQEPMQCRTLYENFHAALGTLRQNARVLIIGVSPEQCSDVAMSAVARGLEGFVRSVAKEIGRKGSTANLVYVEDGAEQHLAPVMRFLVSPRSAFVSGQVLRVSNRIEAMAPDETAAPLRGKIVLITGAAQGLGAATAQRLSEEGAQVICLDIHSSADTLQETAERISGIALQMDVTSADAPKQVGGFIAREFGGVDIVVHNAGVIRDKTLAKMDARRWENVLAVNLDAILRMDRALIEASLLRDHGRIVCLSSIAGIAGNIGQTNYALTKAAVIGYVEALSKQLAVKGITANAVAPGLVETPMMMTMPFVFREVARRMNSLSQAGVPRDVAEVITFLCTPSAAGITGQTIRVCGQNLIGA